MWDNKNATPSWSWFNHQWFVWIFVALYEISKIYNWKKWESNENIEKELKKYKIIFENAEDFDIQYENNVISRHQVKAYKNENTKSWYKDAIISFNIEDIKKNIPCYIHTVCEVKNWDKSKIKWKNKEQEKKNKRVQLYEYNFLENGISERIQKFCPLDGTIHIESQRIISEIREKLYKKISSENNLYKLYEFLNKQISLNHKSGWCPEISFEKIIKIIKQNLGFDDIYVSRLICEYIVEYEKFIDEIEGYQDLSSEDKNIIIYFCEILKQKLFSKDNIELLRMLECWHIHKWNNVDFSTYGFESVILWFCQRFFLKPINDSDKENIEDFLLNIHNMKFTSITEEARRITSIVKDIGKNIENWRFTQDYFNGIQLITERIDVENKFEKISELSNLEEKQMNFLQEDIDENKDNINKPIKFTFISRETALWKI